MGKKILFWIDAKIEEIVDFIRLAKLMLSVSSEKEILEQYYESVIHPRFKTGRKKTLILNYKLFLQELGLLDEMEKATPILKNIFKLIDMEPRFIIEEYILYLLLTNGDYYNFLTDLDEIQNSNQFFELGNKANLIKELKAARIAENLTEKNYHLDKTILLPKFEANGEEWLRIVASELMKKGYYESITALLEGLTRRFSMNYFHRNLKTNFLLETRFNPPHGYKINWDYINSLITKYKHLSHYTKTKSWNWQKFS